VNIKFTLKTKEKAKDNENIEDQPLKGYEIVKDIIV